MQCILLALIFHCDKAHEVEWKQSILLALIFYLGKAHKVEWKQFILLALIFYLCKAHEVEWKQCILFALIFIMARPTRYSICQINNLVLKVHILLFYSCLYLWKVFWKLCIKIYLFDCFACWFVTLIILLFTYWFVKSNEMIQLNKISTWDFGKQLHNLSKEI